MRRKRKLAKAVPVDPIYGSPVVLKLINYLMVDGKKSVAMRLVYQSLQQAGKKLDRKPEQVLEEAIKNTAPVLEVKSRRVGGATYQVPYEVRGERRLQLSLRWIIQASRGRKQRKSMADALSEELILAVQGTGSAVKKRDDTHKMAEANRAFAHFAW